MSTMQVACIGRLLVCVDHRGRFLALAIDRTGEGRKDGDFEVHFAGDPHLCAHQSCTRVSVRGDRVCGPCRERKPNAYLPC